jgi:hypothetical protein
MTLLRLALTTCGGVRFPLVRSRLVHSGQASRPLAALVDTGSAYTIFPMRAALAAGLSHDDVLRAPRREFQGIGARPEPCYECTLDLVVEPSSDRRIVLSNAKVFVVEHVACAFDAILGQRDVLERLELFHRNQPPHPEFVLRLPR